MKNVYKARRCATIIWTDVCEEDRRKNLSKGFKIGLNLLRPWSCSERKAMVEEGESQQGAKFENAVGMLDNYLMKRAVHGLEMDVFEYLSNIHGNMYSLLDCKDPVEEVGDGDDSTYSPDIKRLRRDESSSLRGELANGGGRCLSRDEKFDDLIHGSQDSGVVDNNNRLDRENGNDKNDETLGEVEEDDDRDVNMTRVRRSLHKDMEDTSASQKTSARIEKIVEFISSSADCRQKLKDIHDDKEKSFLKVFYEHREGKTLKDAKLNHFGPLTSDDDIDRVLAALKGYFSAFSGKSTLKSDDVEFVMDVYLPEALAHALHVLEGKSYNDALREIWFGTTP